MIYSDSILKSILYGLYVTLLISILSTVVAIGLSIVLTKSLNGQNKTIRRVSILLIQIIKGIPLLLLLFISYYIFPAIIPIIRFDAFPVSVFVLGLNSAVNITENINLFADLFNAKTDTLLSKRNIILIGLKELGEIVKNSTLVSFLGVLDLYRTASKISAERGNPYMLLYISVIYILIYIMLNVVYRMMVKKYITTTLETRRLQDERQ